MNEETNRDAHSLFGKHIKTHLSLEWEHMSIVDQSCFIYLMGLKMDLMLFLKKHT